MMRLWYKLQFAYYNARWYLRNIIRFRKELANYRPWDWGLTFSLESELWKDTAQNIKKYGNHVNSEKTAKRAFVISALYARIADNDYNTPKEDELLCKWGNMHGLRMSNGTTDKLTDSENRLLIKLMNESNNRQKQELKMLGDYITKYSQSIWD